MVVVMMMMMMTTKALKERNSAKVVALSPSGD